MNKNDDALKAKETTVNAVTNPCYRYGVSPMRKLNVSFEMQIAIIVGRGDTLQVSASPGR